MSAGRISPRISVRTDNPPNGRGPEPDSHPLQACPTRVKSSAIGELHCYNNDSNQFWTSYIRLLTRSINDTPIYFQHQRTNQLTTEWPNYSKQKNKKWPIQIMRKSCKNLRSNLCYQQVTFSSLFTYSLEYDKCICILYHRVG